MFGGSGTDMVQLADTWEFDGATWLETTPAASPPGRFTTSFAYDSHRGRMVMFGGAAVEVGVWSWLNDTWEYGSE